MNITHEIGQIVFIESDFNNEPIAISCIPHDFINHHYEQHRFIKNPNGCQMTKQKKSKPGDLLLVSNESEPVAKRSSALLRLNVDGYDTEDIAKERLTHKEPMLRGQGLSALFRYLKIDDYLSLIKEMLENDPSWSVRADITSLLQRLVRNHKEIFDEVMSLLINHLKQEKHWSVQSSCYESIMGLLGHRHFSIDEFFEMSDVDWEPLKPWLNKPKTPGQNP